MVQRTETQWSTNRIFALALGVVFTLIAIIGFLTPAENSTGVQAIFGIFDVDVLHSIVHLLFGLLGACFLLGALRGIAGTPYAILWAVVSLAIGIGLLMAAGRLIKYLRRRREARK